MGYQVFPNPLSVSLPPGASSILTDGVANQSGFTYTSSTISAGSKIFYVQNEGGDLFVVNSPNSKKSTILFNNQYAYIKNTTSETNMSVAVISDIKQTITFTSIIGENVAWSSQAGLLAVINATPRMAVIRISSDYSTWTTIAQFTSNGTTPGTESGVVYGDSKWIALSGTSSRGYLFSTNGTNWTSRGDALAIRAQNGAHFDGQYFVFVNDQYLHLSTDGLTWTSVGTPTNTGNTGIAYSEQGAAWAMPMTAYADNPSRFHFSTNQGQNWTSVAAVGPSATTGRFGSVTYGNGMFVFGGADSTNTPIVNITTNRTTMTMVKIGAPVTNAGGTVAVKFVNGIFIVAVAEYVFYSTDAIRWATMPLVVSNNLTNRQQFRSFSFDNNRISQNWATGIATTNKTPYYAMYNTTDKTIN